MIISPLKVQAMVFKFNKEDAPKDTKGLFESLKMESSILTRRSWMRGPGFQGFKSLLPTLYGF